MALGDGVAAAREIKNEFPATRIVMLTATSDDLVLRQAIEAGCSGYLTKDHTVDELILAVRAAHNGEALISPAMLSRLLDRLGDRTRPGSDLTRRETEVLRLLARGLSNSEICARLVISDATAKTHVAHILQKLGLRDRMQTVIYAYENGLVTPRSSD